MEGGKERRGAYDIAAELMEHTLPGKEDYTKIIHPTSVTEKREGVIHLYMYQYRGRGGVETQGAYSLERGRIHINHLDRWRATKSKSFCEGREHSSLPLDCT